MLPRLQVQTFGLMFFPPNNSAFNHSATTPPIVIMIETFNE